MPDFDIIDTLPSETLDPASPDYQKHKKLLKKAMERKQALEKAEEEARQELEIESILADELSRDYQIKLKERISRKMAEFEEWKKERAIQVKECKENSMFKFKEGEGYIVDQDIPINRVSGDSMPDSVAQALSES